MYKELISQISGGLSQVKLQPPCSAKEITKAEQSFEIKFPRELVDMLREINGDRFLLWSTEEIIDNNYGCRKLNSDIIDTELFDFSEYFFIAGNGIGDYYGYKLENGAVRSTDFYMFEHESYTSRLVARSLADLIKLYYQDKI